MDEDDAINLEAKPSLAEALNATHRLSIALYRALANQKRVAERTDAIERARKHAAEALRLLEGM